MSENKESEDEKKIALSSKNSDHFNTEIVVKDRFYSAKRGGTNDINFHRSPKYDAKSQIIQEENT